MNKEFDYIIIGAGIAGCCIAYFLSKYSKSILLIDKNEKVMEFIKDNTEHAIERKNQLKEKNLRLKKLIQNF